MKGNEARVVFFINPVDHFPEGQQGSRDPGSRGPGNLLVVGLVLLLVLILGIGVFVFVFFDKTIEPTVTERPTEERPTSNEERGNHSTAETAETSEAPTVTTLPGIKGTPNKK